MRAWQQLAYMINNVYNNPTSLSTTLIVLFSKKQTTQIVTFPLSQKSLGYVWFPESIKEKKCKGKWFFHVWFCYKFKKKKIYIIKIT